MIKTSPKVFKTIVTVLKNQKVNYAMFENKKLHTFEEIPISIQEFRSKFGNAHIIKSIYKDNFNSESLFSQYIETTENNLRMGFLINYKNKTAAAVVKSFKDNKESMRLSAKFSTETPLFVKIKDDVFLKFKQIFDEVPNYFVTAFKDNKAHDLFVVRNADAKVPHPSTFSLKKEGEMTELGKIWGYIKKL